MKILSVLFILLLFFHYGTTQNLEGKWKWENKNLSGEVYFDSKSYFIKVFLKNSDVKISESFSYYKTSNDTLIFSQINFEENPSKFKYYKIKKLTNEKLELIDLSTNEIDNYSNLDHKNYN